MDTNDKELFETSLTDEPIEAVAEVETPEPEAQAVDGPARDEQGRFAPKEPEPVVQAQIEPQGNDAQVPSWRLRELRERAEAAETRAREVDERWQRQFNELQSRLPKQEPTPAPDVFEDPNKFLEYGVKQAVDPIRSEITQLREAYSKKWAEKEHGAEKVKAAYDWVAQGMQTRDPEVAAIYQRAMQSMDPYGEIITAHQQKAVYSQIGNDPNAWFEKELEKRLADPQFAASQLQKIQSGVRSAPGTQANQIKLPPSIGRVPSSHSASEDVGDMSDGSLFAQAMR